MSFCLFKKSHTEDNVNAAFKDLKKHKKSNEDLLAIRLMQKMLLFDAVERATAPEVLRHAFFWNSSRWIGFLLEIGNKIEKNVVDQKLMRKISIDPTLKLLQDKIDIGSFSVVGKDWKFRLDQQLVDQLEPWRFKKVYDGTKLTELIRAFRNLNFPEKAMSGKFTEIYFLKYFTKRFPALLMHVHEVVEANAKDLFTEYFSQHGAVQKEANGHFDDEGKHLTLSFEQQIDYSRFKNSYEYLVLSGLNFKFLEREEKLSNFLQTQCKMVKHLRFNECNLDALTVIKLCKKLPCLEELVFRESRNIHENDILPKTFHREFELPLKHLHMSDSDFFDVFDRKDNFISIHNSKNNQDPRLMNLISQQNALKVLEVGGNLERFHLKLYQINFQLSDLRLSHDVKGSVPKRNILNFIKTQFKLEKVHLCFDKDQIVGDFSCFVELFDQLFQQNPIREINLQLNCCMLKYLQSTNIISKSVETLWCRVFNADNLKPCANCLECDVMDSESNLQSFLNRIGKLFPNHKQLIFLDEDQIDWSDDIESRTKSNKFIRYRIKEVRNFNWLSKMKVLSGQNCEITFITNDISDSVEKINLRNFEGFASNNMDLKDLTVVFSHFASDNMLQRKCLQSLLKIILKNLRTLENLNIDSEQRNMHQNYNKNLNKVPEYLREVLGELSKLRTLKKWKIIGFSKN